MNVADWLRALGLEQYEAAFRENDVDVEILPTLTADELREIGVSSIRHRRLLLEAIAVRRSRATEAEAPALVPPFPLIDLSGQPGASEAAAERRPLSVMFCDLVGSTALSARLDPEDLREIIRTYQACVATTIQHFNGFIARYVGDGVLIYFGWPEARETDVERAVRAGLAVAAAVREVPVGGDPLHVRIGIATGLVVIGEPIGSGDSRQQTAVGETPNLAARLQSLAGPDQVVIDAATRRQIGGLFAYRDLGTVALRGFTEDVPVWQVLGVGTESRFEALHGTTTPLVGRDEDMELLLRRWSQAKAGNGRVVLISAEPGVGKSRLAEVLAERITAEAHVRLRYFCSPHHRDSALYPVIAQMERAAGFQHADDPATRLAKLQALLAPATQMEDLALVAELHALPSADLEPPLDVTPQRKREKTFEALLRQVEDLSRRHPTLIIFDDLHWIDPSSRELLDRMIERVANWPVLLLAMFRPEFQPPWTGQPHVTMLILARLDRRDAAAMVGNVAGDATLPPEIVEEIAERTDGVPLFVEELTKAVLESGAQAPAALSTVSLPALSVPATLHASLMARLDRLGSAAKEVAQTGAAIGREFGHGLLASVCGLPKPKLNAALDRLTNSGLLFVRGMPPESTYIFKHALVQDAAYGTLLRTRRQQLHARIAVVLENQFAEFMRTKPELLAFHHQYAGNVKQSFDYWTTAGDVSDKRGASLEAITHYRSALKLLDTRDPPHTIRLREPELGIKLGNALMQAEGYNSEDGRVAFSRAQSTAAKLELPEDYARATIGNAPLSFGQCRYRSVVDTGEGISAKLLHQLRPQTRVHLWAMLAAANYGNGEFKTALAYATQAATLDDNVQCTHESPVGGGDPAIVCRCFAEKTSTAMGLLEKSAAWSEEAFAIANARGHAFSIAWAYLSRMRSLNALGRYAESILIGNEAIEICERRGFIARLGGVLFERGEARLAIGDREEGLEEMRRGKALWHRTSGTFHVTQYISEFVPCLLKVGRTVEAEHALQEAEAFIAKTDEQSHHAEIQRLRGQLHEDTGERERAGVCYRQALEWSHAHHAKLFELRAGTNLARLWRDQSKRVEARDLLGPIYNWFTEGLDAPDLKDAKALLEELA
jgi:class 3 adenylate cyclase/tetratricopeptide (TPR) repeat protein